MRKWLISILFGESSQSFALSLMRIETGLESLAVVTQAHSAQLERIEQTLVKSTVQAPTEQERPSSSASSNEDERPLHRERSESPIPTTRSSWPRMRKLLEEREVRKELDLKRDQDAIVGRNRQFNREAEAVADYWTRKQQGE